MFIFHNSEFLWFLLLLLPLAYFIRIKGSEFENLFSKEVLKKIQVNSQKLSKRVRNVFLLIAFSLSIIAIARPQIDNGEIQVKASFINVIAGIDMSKSMFADDIYPNRFEFAKQKFFESLKDFKNAKVALIGFSSQPFLISPLTQDFHSLKFLGKNLSLEHLSLQGTDILATLSSANEMFQSEHKKILLLFTDGGDQKEFSKEIEYAKKHKIVVYIYNIGTIKGGAIKEKGGVLKDKKGNIVIVKRTDKIKKLAMETGGAYMKYSLANDDIKLLTETIQAQFKAKEEESSTIKDRREIFYYPLLLAILFYFIALFSLPTSNKRSQ